MPGNPPPRGQLPERGAYRPRTPTYRYRNGVWKAPPYSRLITVDLNLLRLEPGDRVIDVGCGTGRHVVEVSRRPCYVVGLDRDPNELWYSKAYLYFLICDGAMKAKANLLLGDGDRLPFADGSFDRVICTEVLEHVPDDERLVRELTRILRPGGTMALSVPHHVAETISWQLASLRRLPITDHVRIYDRRRLKDLLGAEGLVTYACRRRHSLESLYWLLAFACGKRSAAFAFYEDFVERRAIEGSVALRWIEATGDRILPKSLVVYCRKPRERRTA